MKRPISEVAPLEEWSASRPRRDPPLSAKLRQKLEALDEWRVDALQLKIVNDGPRVEGGFAVVCRASLMVNSTRAAADAAIDTQGDVDVAVKIIKIKEGDNIHQILRRAVREADIIKDLDHENIITLEGFVEDIANGRIWLIFPWAEMGNMRDFVASEDWSIPERIYLIDDVARGVEHLHSRKPPICHGDLKSINILVNSNGRAVITDFGSARRLRNTHKEDEQEAPPPAQNPTADETAFSVEFCENSNTMTFTGTKYTLRWAAPEVLSEEDAGTAADIWSMGWVFYEIMTGSIPFENVQKDAAIVGHIVRRELPSLKDHERMSPILELVSLMIMCWEIGPECRPSAERCRKYVSHMPMSAPRSKKSLGTALEASRRLLHEGMMYKLQNDYDKALGAFNDAREGLGDQAKSSKEGGGILWGIADVHRLRNEYDEAAALYAEVAQICEEIGDRRGKAYAQFGLAEVHRARDEFAEAAALYAEAAQICEEIGDRAGKADAQFGLAEIHRLRGEYAEAAALYAEVVQICEEVGDRGGKATARKGLADVHWARDEYDEAATLYAEVAQTREEIGNRAGKASAQSGLAEIHRLRGEYAEAAAMYAEVVQICEEVGNRGGKACAQFGLAEIHRVRGEYDEAAALYREVAGIHEEIGDRGGKATARKGLADVHWARDEYDEAATLYVEVVLLCEEIGNRGGKADAQRGLAEVHRARKEYAESLQLFMESSQVSRACGNNLGLAYSLRGIADVYDNQERFKDATRFYEDAAEIFAQIGFAEDASDALEWAADTRRKDYELSQTD